MNLEEYNKHYINLSICDKIKSLSDHPFNKQVGSIIVNYKNEIISHGYNKFLSKDKNPEYKDMSICHAEEMALASFCNDLYNNATIYVSSAPCTGCSRCIILSGIKKLVYPKNNIISNKWINSCNHAYNLLKDNDIEIIELDMISNNNDKSLKRKLHNDEYINCPICNTYMKLTRQLCCKTYCNEESKWYIYNTNNELLTIFDIDTLKNKVYDL